jgi:hypothetical protein
VSAATRRRDEQTVTRTERQTATPPGQLPEGACVR